MGYSRASRSTISLKPFRSSFSVMGSHTAAHSEATSVKASRDEDAASREVVNYDDLVAMPWGQESLAHDFLHLYGQEQYIREFKQRQELEQRNFAELSRNSEPVNELYIVDGTDYFAEHKDDDEAAEAMINPFWFVDEQGFSAGIG